MYKFTPANMVYNLTPWANMNCRSVPLWPNNFSKLAIKDTKTTAMGFVPVLFCL